MAQEIEKKFLVAGDGWRVAADGSPIVGTPFNQGYLATEPERNVRVRTEGERGTLTIKSKGEGSGSLVRREFEYEIPRADVEQILAFCKPTPIEKTRYRVRHGDHVWEIDEFHGANDGLLVAEIELSVPDEPFARPDWLGDDVTDDPRYLNANLVETPFSTW
ncbi:MAG: CYTH domain-containing protein [Acidobacteriota bacterium]